MKNFIRNTLFYKYYKKLKASYSSAINGNPSKDMFVIGITGTDGKTTTSNLIHHIINNSLGKCALVTTLNIKYGDEDIFNKSKMTSLDPSSLQKVLSQAKAKECKYVVLEVSSHGLDQFRFHGIDFDLGILTNISSEHLDYHKTIENYAETKKKLFLNILKNPKSTKYAVLPKDSEYGRKWSEDLVFDKMMDFGLVLNAGLKAESIVERVDGTSFKVKYLGKDYPFNIRLLGKFNVYNSLAAIATGILLGIKIDKLIPLLDGFSSLSGRMERVEHNGVHYFIDFAHTPNALDSVLKYLNQVKGSGKIITLFGAPGLRDKFKRPMMGKIVDKLSDYIIVTDDDPDKEDRYEIINQILSGVTRKEGNGLYILPEREFALKMAVSIAKPGDIVLLAGKGHEKIQITNFGKRDWNDKDQLLKILNEGNNE
ncbi:MAG: UDP-N-acetylmuramoyl-L-alanyl-D-glutamate--2,6-diaminopimelate ligase [Candidatus Absconditabacteria bacterium]